MDFTGPAPLGSQAALMALPSQRRAPDLKAVDPGHRGDGAGTDARRRPEQEQTAAVARDIVALRREASQRDLPVGPPPAFKVSLLEMESDLKHVLARVEAARAKARDADALRIEADGAAAAATAEAEGLSRAIADTEAIGASTDTDAPFSATTAGSLALDQAPTEMPTDAN